MLNTSAQTRLSKTLSLTSKSGISPKNLMATEERASGGQPENQSIVQQVTNAGNCLRRARNISPNGLQSG